MVRPDEETRARLYWAQQRQQAAARRARNAALRGNAAAADAVRDGWEPILLARLESRQWARDDDEEDCG